MKKLLLSLLLTPIALAHNPMRDMGEFSFVTIERNKSVHYEELKLNDELTGYVITLTSDDDRADFEFMCDFTPFFYPPEIKLLKPNDMYQMTITVQNDALSINHYTLQPSGVLRSKEYLTNQFSALLEEVITSRHMRISLDNAMGKPIYTFSNYDAMLVMDDFLLRCAQI